jgi:hypothetical protein
MWCCILASLLTGAEPILNDLAPPVQLEAGGQSINVGMGHAAPSWDSLATASSGFTPTSARGTSLSLISSSGSRHVRQLKTFGSQEPHPSRLFSVVVRHQVEKSRFHVITEPTALGVGPAKSASYQRKAELLRQVVRRVRVRAVRFGVPQWLCYSARYETNRGSRDRRPSTPGRRSGSWRRARGARPLNHARSIKPYLCSLL